MTKQTEAAIIVAKAAEVATQTAERVAEAAAARIAVAVKEAAQAVSVIAQTQANIASTDNAIAKTRLDSMEKRYDMHELEDGRRFDAITEGQKDLKSELKGEIKDLALDQKKQTRTITLFTGGFIALSSVLQILLPLLFSHHP